MDKILLLMTILIIICIIVVGIDIINYMISIPAENITQVWS